MKLDTLKKITRWKNDLQELFSKKKYDWKDDFENPFWVEVRCPKD